MMLTRAALTATSVPAAGQRVYLRSTANLSTGGTATDVTDVIHPDNRDMAVRAVRAIGLDVGGVDFLSKDITLSYKEIGGGICEINAAPGFRMHVAPSEGTPRDAAGPVIDMLFPQGTPARVPIAAITGTNGKTTTARMLAHILKMAGYTPGLTTTDGVYIDGQRTVSGDMTGPVSARMVLSDPHIDAAVLETARGGLLRAGMGVPAVDVGAVLNVQADHLGLKGIDTLEQLAEVKRVVVEVATGCAVLNADDPLVLRMSAHTDAEHICYVTMNPQHTLVREHIRAGGRACALEAGVNGQMVTLYDRGGHIPLVWTHLIPATVEGRATHNVQNAMFAASMAFSLGVKLDAIRQGLRTFDTTFYQAPGRMNFFDEHPFKVLFDYGHNAHAVSMLADLAGRLDVTGRRIVVLAGPGDRRDDDLRAIARAVAGRFDHYICRRDDNLRDRAPDEVPRIQAAALGEAGVPPSAISVIPDEQEAIDAALAHGLARRPAADLCGCAGALVEADHPLPSRRRARGRRARAGTGCGRAGHRAADRERDAAVTRRPDPRRARHPLCAGGVRLSGPDSPPFTDSRRLTGHNRFFDGPGAVLETTESDAGILQDWERRVRLAQQELRWPAAPVVAVAHASGASLALGAPPDQLFTATEANEWALCATLAERDPSRSAEPDRRARRRAAGGDGTAGARRRRRPAAAAPPRRARGQPAPARAARCGDGARAALALRRRPADARRGRGRARLAAAPVAGRGRDSLGRAARHSDRPRHRHQRQDDGGAPHRRLHRGLRPQDRLQLHRWRVRRRARDRHGRLLGTRRSAPRAARHARRGGRARDRARRHPAPRPRGRQRRCRRDHQHRGGSLRRVRHPRSRRADRGQARPSRAPWARRACWSRTPTTRCSRAWHPTPASRSAGSRAMRITGC